MRYARWDDPGFTVCTHEAAEPGPGELLVRVALATICGSDVHTVDGKRPAPAPSVLGHEQVGTVVAAGPGAPASPGDRIIWSVTASCGSCARCAGGFPQKCLRLRKYGHEKLDPQRPLTGGYATHCLLLPGTAVAVVPSSVPDAVAAPAACATATVAAVVAAAGPIRPGTRALVAGAGMLGLTATAMLASRGAHVMVVDPYPQRAERARLFGAADVGSAFTEVDVALELSGAHSAVTAALDALTVGGTLVLAGSVFPGPPVALDPERIVRGWHTVTGVHNYRPADLEAAVGFLAGRGARYPFESLVEGAYPLDDLEAAFAAARTGTSPRVAVRP
jgi:putative phosphonate catabolism associated alcohol dehydrogenase